MLYNLYNAANNPRKELAKVVPEIKIPAILIKATTTIDGGWRITFDIDSSQTEIVTKLVRLRDKLLSLEITEEQRENIF